MQLPVIMLDRPNPISGLTPEGPLLDPAYTSFVGMAPVPIRHALTAGELALMCNEVLEYRLQVRSLRRRAGGAGCGSTRPGCLRPAVAQPADAQSLTVYPGTCLVEGTNFPKGGARRAVRVHRRSLAGWGAAGAGAQRPTLPGVRFRPAYFVPTFSKYQGELCAAFSSTSLTGQLPRRRNGAASHRAREGEISGTIRLASILV